MSLSPMMTRCPMDLRWIVFYGFNVAMVAVETIAAVLLWS